MDDGSKKLDSVLEGLPPSAKLVAKVLEREGELSQEEISRRARLSGSTARDALRELADEGVVEAEVDSSDGRRLVYSIEQGC